MLDTYLTLPCSLTSCFTITSIEAYGSNLGKAFGPKIGICDVAVSISAFNIIS